MEPSAGQDIPPTVRQAIPLGRRPRIILHYDETGGLDLSRLEPDVRNRLQDAFRQQAPIEKTDPELIKMVLTGLGNVEAAMLSSKFDLSNADCRNAIGPHEPLAGMIAAAGARVVDKHNLTGRWGDEIALFALLASWQAGALQQIRAMQATKKAAEDATRGNMGTAETGKVNASPVVSAGDPS